MSGIFASCWEIKPDLPDVTLEFLIREWELRYPVKHSLFASTAKAGRFYVYTTGRDGVVDYTDKHDMYVERAIQAIKNAEGFNPAIHAGIIFPYKLLVSSTGTAQSLLKWGMHDVS